MANLSNGTVFESRQIVFRAIMNPRAITLAVKKAADSYKDSSLQTWKSNDSAFGYGGSNEAEATSSATTSVDAAEIVKIDETTAGDIKGEIHYAVGESSNSYSPTAKGKRCDIEAANSTGSNSNSSCTANDVIEGVGPENEEEEDEKANKTGERSGKRSRTRGRDDEEEEE